MLTVWNKVKGTGGHRINYNNLRNMVSFSRKECLVGLACTVVLLKFTVGSLPAVDGYDSADSSASYEEPMFKYENHLNNTRYQTINEKQMVGVHRRNFPDPEDLKATYSSNTHPRFDQYPFHCSACQFRSVFAKASLKSIKAHVLMKLGFEHPPNQTNYPKVPDDILKNFNEKISPSQQSRMRDAGDNQYMGDDPSVHDQPDEIEDEFDYYQITNKIYIFPNRKLISN
ncbi:uncharacterized protein LOC129750732 [Uranotaenia lowii]|uniref:uncharacterized protein LOC129750731 n=1 Tax=Uranotaenia lowii TaxID=190385 RepID=UPI00247B1135|nr:uncharacterized protein LOC129750731 [Uranotaenia lowii]XP_055601720.1 uncharacterized protein LOC129750731 [Uranotaenia lowii]XP_055601722.1 uncharacterized protein LOC129750732 [Uranotaenia lowii]XP_055601723.1 uncharacterized protein LOC129750732 [Uranotaenia lowii]